MESKRQQVQTKLSATKDTWTEILRRRRQGQGWSLADLSARTGLSRAYLSALERGQSKRPSAETMQRLEAAVGPIEQPIPPANTPPGLAELAAEQRLTASDVVMLASLRIRGRQPQTKERWSFIYQAMLASESIDERSGAYQRTKKSSKERGA